MFLNLHIKLILKNKKLTYKLSKYQFTNLLIKIILINKIKSSNQLIRLVSSIFILLIILILLKIVVL